MAELNVNNVTTYITAIVIAVFGYVGISSATTDLVVQLLAPVLAIIIPIVITYYNEKYPSKMVTPVYTEDEVQEIKEEESDVDGI